MINYLASKSIPKKVRIVQMLVQDIPSMKMLMDIVSYDSFCEDDYKYKCIVGYEEPAEEKPDPMVIPVSSISIASGDIVVGLNIGSFNEVK